MRELHTGKLNRIVILLDDEDYNRVSNFSWNLSGKHNTTLQATVDRTSITLPRFILQYAGPLEVDHINRNIFDNQKSNFRLATKSQQMANTGPRGKKYKGICFDKRRRLYFVRITHNGQIISTRGFLGEEEAAKEYDRIAYKLWGEFAYLNFPRIITI